jgi:uncharacterized membrane protein
MLKKTLTISLFILSFFISVTVNSEEILDFKAELYLSGDGTLMVEEEIEYDFQSALRHGIYRDIPYKYDYGYKKQTIELDVEEVSDFNGEPYQYKVSKSGDRVNIRIGDPDTKITGVNGYRIQYFVDGAIAYFDDYDEIYWNVTGNEWRVPIRHASAKVSFENGVPEGVKALCYTGSYGSKSQDCEIRINPDSIEFETVNNLNAGQGLTIVVGMPKGVVDEPSALSKLIRLLMDNWYFALPFATLISLYYIWRSRGKDPEGRGVIAVRYEPPENLTPAEAGTLIDERADILDVSSTVIDLAVRGYIKIEEVKSTKFYFFTDRDYKLVKIKDSEDADLKAHESKVLSGIFEGSGETMVSSLKNKFYKELPGIKKALYKELIDKRYFPANPENVRRIYKWAGVVLVIIAFFLMSNFPLGVSLGISGIVILLFAGHMPRKTKRGSLLNEELLGFREFIERAEEDRIRRMAKEDPTLFDRVLPYALVFGLEDKWADAFREMYTEPPNWYYSPYYANAFSPSLFVNDLGRSLSVMQSTLASTPKRSGSSGLGGGGSSGGGFGGGGGGSW